VVVHGLPGSHSRGGATHRGLRDLLVSVVVRAREGEGRDTPGGEEVGVAGCDDGANPRSGLTCRGKAGLGAARPGAAGRGYHGFGS